MTEGNPYTDSARIARRIIAERSAFRATVVSVSGAQVEVRPDSGAASLGLCTAARHVAARAVAGDRVICMYVGGDVFVLDFEATATPEAPALWVPAVRFIAAGGSPDLAARGSTATAHEKAPGWALDAASAESVVTVVELPADYANGAIDVTVYLAPSGSGSGNVVLALYGAAVEASSQIDQASDFTASATIAMPGVADQRTTHTFTAVGTALNAGPLRLAVYRDAANGSDTYSADVWLIGCRVTYRAREM